MTVLSRDAIIDVDDLPRELVPVPEWGGDVFVRSLTAAERDAYNNSLFRVQPRKGGRDPEISYHPENATARLVVLTVVGEDGKRLFKDGDLDKVARKNAKALERLAAVARRLSGIDEESQAELLGNSGPAPSGGSASG